MNAEAKKVFLSRKVVDRFFSQLEHHKMLIECYEGRTINKLQYGAIQLILKIGKIRNIRFVGNLILNIQRDIFLTMTSLL